jgi:hypothetical protein
MKEPITERVVPSDLSPGHRIRYTNNYHTESAGNETLVYTEPKEHPKPKVSIKLVPSNPIYSASKSLKDAFAAWEL